MRRPKADAGGEEEERIAPQPPNVECGVVAEVQKQKSSQNWEEGDADVAHRRVESSEGGLIVFVALCRKGIERLVGLAELALGRFTAEKVAGLHVPDARPPMSNLGILRHLGGLLRLVRSAKPGEHSRIEAAAARLIHCL